MNSSKTYDNVLFDLDGTLTDSFHGITNSVVYALKKFGIEVEDKRKLSVFIGPPLFESFSVHFGMSDDDAVRAVSYYREYYSEKGIYESVVYDGVVPLLEELKARGKKLYVATSKPEVFSVKIIEHFGLSKYFEFVAGALLDKSRIEKADIIKYAVATNKLDAGSCVMVGDRKHDILGAKESGMTSIGVLYGYGSREELASAGADYIVDTPTDILKLNI